MKELWQVFIDKLKEVEANAVAMGFALVGVFTIIMSTIVIVKIVNMLVKIVEAFAPHAH